MGENSQHSGTPLDKTFLSYFTGYDLVGCAAKELGLELVGGVEIEPELAAVANANLGNHVIVADVCQVDPATLPRANFFWASPVCKNASLANTGAEETETDRKCARAVVRYLAHHKPTFFFLENVFGYRTFDSFRIILDGLKENGYQHTYQGDPSDSHLVAADFGVPQTRRRLFVVGRRDGKRPCLPAPTHAQFPTGQGSLFSDALLPWVGWYEAIADLIPTLPESKFADWQLQRLQATEVGQSFLHMTCNTQKANPTGSGVLNTDQPANTVVSSGHSLRSRAFLVDSKNSGQEFGDGKWLEDEPAMTVTSAGGDRPSHLPKALIVEGTAGGTNNAFSLPMREEDEPVFTVRTGNMPRAILFGHDSKLTTRDGDEPAFTSTAESVGDQPIRALLIEGDANASRDPSRRDATDPSFTVTAQMGRRPAAIPKAVLIGDQRLQYADALEPAFSVRAHESGGTPPRAFLVADQRDSTGLPGGSDRDLRPIAVRPAPEPAPTVKSSEHKGLAKGLLETGRVVQMTPEALGRFQTLPRWYKLSGNRRRDCTGIGNGVACLMAKAIIRSVME